MHQGTTQYQQVVYVTRGKSRISYILLGLFFGGFGIHDFYAGYAGKGMLKIVVSFLGVFLFVGGLFATAATAIAGEIDAATMPTPETASMPLMASLGIAMLGVQSLYIIFQLIITPKDSKGVPFSYTLLCITEERS